MTLTAPEIAEENIHRITWFEENWRRFLFDLAEIRERAVQYAVPVGGYLTNTGPCTNGVYFLWLGSDLQYVGKATSICHRLTAHRKARQIDFDRISWIECPIEWAEEVEHYYLRTWRPPCNRKYTGSFGYKMQALVERHHADRTD